MASGASLGPLLTIPAPPLVSRDPAVLSVSSTDMLHALAEGTASVIATVDEWSDTLTVLVSRSAESSTCAIAADGSRYCWGSNGAGQLGDGTTMSRAAPARVNTTATFVSLAAGAGMHCGLTTTGAAYCWGAAGGSVLRTPTPVAGGRVFAQIGGRESQVCARTSTGDVYCWTPELRWHVIAPTPTVTGRSAINIAVGWNHACAIAAAGDAFCWGSISGQLGRTPSGTFTTPVAVPGGLRYSALSAGGNATCGIADGKTYCLGMTYLRDADFNASQPQLIPQTVSYPFVALTGGGFHTCAIDALGGAWCWGVAVEGQLGAGERSGLWPR